MLLWLILAALVCLAGLEVVLRVAVGLGDPPLYATHPDIEYLPVPGRYRRFRNSITYNRFHMRGPEIEPVRTHPRELRVLVIGDSIVNAGVRVDDALVGTRLLERCLAAELDRPVRVLNIGASSWGPLNQLGYVRTFGTFDAEAAVLVYNCSDIGDGLPPPPGAQVLGFEHPTRKPILALQEVLQKYVPRYLGMNAAPVTHDTTNPPAEIRDYNARLVLDLIEFLRSRSIKVGAVMAWMASEIQGGPTPGTTQMAEVLRSLGVPTVDSGPEFRAAMDRGRWPFLAGDEAHPNALGQSILACVMREALRQAGAVR